MTLVVPDSNILYSCLRTANSKARRILLTRPDLVFYTPNFLITEIFTHSQRLRANSKLSDAEFVELFDRLIKKLHFVNEETLDTGNLIHAHRLCNDIDPKDTLFVALVLQYDGKLWTRDEALRTGLWKKGFRAFFDEE